MIDNVIIDAVITVLNNELPRGIKTNISNISNINPNVAITLRGGVIADNRLVNEISKVCTDKINGISSKDIIAVKNDIYIDCSKVGLSWRVVNDIDEREDYSLFRMIAEENYVEQVMELAAYKYERNETSVSGVYMQYSIEGHNSNYWIDYKIIDVDNKTIYRVVANYIRTHSDNLRKKDIKGLYDKLRNISDKHGDTLVKILDEMFSGAGIDISKYM
jgi:hypothetical protein